MYPHDFDNASHTTTSTVDLGNSNRTVDNAAWESRDEQLAMLEVALMGITFSIALVGNSAVLIVLLMRRQKITRMYFFIFHLSLADLAVAFFNILPQMIWDITWRFQGNDFLCKTIKFLQVFAMYLSAWVLVMMAFDRHHAIVRPLDAYSWRARRCTIMIVIAWLLSGLCSLPQVFVFSQKEILNGVFDCWASFSEPYGSQIYVMWFALSIYVVPLCILVVTYGQVTWTVWKVIRLKENGTLRIKANGTTSVIERSRSRSQATIQYYRPPASVSYNGGNLRQTPGLPRTTHSTYRRVYNRTKLLTIKMTAVVICCYVFCWTPFIFSLLWTTFFPLTATEVPRPVFTILLLLANLNSCTNPWIYLFFSLGKYVRCVQWWRPRWLNTAAANMGTPGISEHDEGEATPRRSSFRHNERKDIFGIPLADRTPTEL